MPGLLSFGKQLYPNPLLSQRNVINIWYTDSEWNYSFIDHLILADNSMTPYGATFNNAWSATKTFRQVVDQNGWVNDATGSGQTWGCGVRMPSSSNFAGPYVITWEGDGKVQFTNETWTEASTSIVRTGNANGTTTLSGFTDVTGLAVGFPVSGTGVSGGTTIVSINYGTKTIVVSASVTSGTGISFTFTNNSYTRNANGQWTNATGKKGYVVVSHSGYGGPPNLIGFQVATTGLGGAISVSSMSWSAGVVTVTTASPHGRPLGYSLALTFSGATPSSVNSTFTCTVTGASTYTFDLASDPGSITGTITYIAFLTNVRLYRLEDETDFMPTAVGGNGYIFRAPYKQVMVDMRPAAIRPLNWVNGNDSLVYRFENRSLPSKAGSTRNSTAGPAYDATSGTNQISVSAVSTPFPGNKNLTTASMVHGELCSTRLTNATSSGSNTITAITQANPGVVTTSASHGYSNGDQVWFAMPYSGNAPASMKEMDRVAAIVANATATTFELTDLDGANINTTSFTAFSTTPGTNRVYRYVSLVVGSGNDRVAYPVVQGGGGNGNPSFNAGVNGLSADTNYTFYFDKNQAGRRTAGTSANWVQGAWLVRSNQPWGDVPIEHCAALVAECNILSQSQGIATPIHLWLTVPPTCLLDCDPDYSADSEYPINAINAVFNGGYGCIGLSATNASLILEWSNELWNFGTFTANYTNWLGYLRGTLNTANFESIQALRSTRMMRAIRASSAWSSRVYGTLGMQGITGWGQQNRYVALGDLVSASNIIFTDPWNNWGSAPPIDFHEAVDPATYLQPTSTYSNTRYGTGTLTDDSAMYNGTDNSASVTATFTAGNPSIAGTNSFTSGDRLTFTSTVGNIAASTVYRVSSTGLSGSAFQITSESTSTIITPNTNGSASTPAGGNYSGAADTAQAIANFVDNLVSFGTGDQQTINNYCSEASPTAGILGQYNTAMAARGKRVIQYEGGTDWACAVGGVQGNHTLTSGDSAFLNAVNQSSQWADAQAQFFDNIKNLSNHGPAALYLYLKLSTGDLRWGYAAPDSYAGGVEGDNLTTKPIWTTIAARNALLSP